MVVFFVCALNNKNTETKVWWGRQKKQRAKKAGDGWPGPCYVYAPLSGQIALRIRHVVGATLITIPLHSNSRSDPHWSHIDRNITIMQYASNWIAFMWMPPPDGICILLALHLRALPWCVTLWHMNSARDTPRITLSSPLWRRHALSQLGGTKATTSNAIATCCSGINNLWANSFEENTIRANRKHSVRTKSIKKLNNHYICRGGFTHNFLLIISIGVMMSVPRKKPSRLLRIFRSEQTVDSIWHEASPDWSIFLPRCMFSPLCLPLIASAMSFPTLMSLCLLAQGQQPNFHIN